MVLGLFKSKEKKEKEELEKSYDAALERVIFTPESKSEYEKRVGYAVEVIETEKRNKGILFHAELGEYCLVGGFGLKKRLVEAGIEAIVETNYSHTIIGFEYRHRFYGLPVAKKERRTV